MNTLSVSMFGKIQVQLGNKVLTGLNAHKAQDLLCYLLLYRHRPHPREELATLFWDDIHTTQSRRYLRKALWQLQATLESQARPPGKDLLLVEPDWVQINPLAGFRLDVATFEQAFSSVSGVSGRELDSQQVLTLLSALGLYRGDLLEGCYEEWCLYNRERFRYMYLVMLDKLMDYSEAHRHYEVGLACGALILDCDRARERTHRRMMRLHYLTGDRTAALRQYEQCVAALDEELDVRPAKRTVMLYEQICLDKARDLSPPATTDVATPEMSPSPLPEVLRSLRRCQAALDDAHRQIQRVVDAIELALNGES